MVAALVAATMCLPVCAGAQQLHGILRDSTTGQPVTGAVVWLTDGEDKFLARSVSRDSGRFVLPRFANATRLHAIRIGYRPVTATLAAAPGDTILTASMTPIPLLLHAVASNGRRVCPGDARDTVALDLWNQARSALLASVVAREAAPPHITIYSYTQRLDPVNKRVTDDSSRIKSLVADNSYVAARPAWAFADDGYIQEGRGDRTYYAPDDAVLLDTSFVETHCLRVASADAAHENEVGVGFEPTDADGRDTLVDIKGTLWLDARSPRLRSIEFTYTGLEPAASGSGGEITFDLVHGVPMIARWQIHYPVLVDNTPPSWSGLPRRPLSRSERSDYNVLYYQRTGGQLISATWPDANEEPAALPRVVGQVIDTAGTPLAGMRVWVRETGDTVVSNADGRFQLPRMKPGSYVVFASDSLLAGQGIARTAPRTVLLQGAQEFTTKLVVYPRAAVLKLICPTGAYRPNTGVALVHVVDLDGKPVPDARIAVGASTAPADSLALVSDGRAAVDPGGRFSVCGAPLDQPLHIHASKAGAAGDAVVSSWKQPLVAIDITLRRP